MNINRRLEEIQIGEADLDSARQTIAMLLAPGKLSNRSAADVTDALEAWTWRALRDRRSDADLPGWLELILSAGARVNEGDAIGGAALKTFGRLVRRSLDHAAKIDPAAVVARKHAKEILRALSTANGASSRAALRARLGLKEANLTRVMAPLIDLGLVTRQIEGREVSYGLTDEGRRVAGTIVARGPVDDEMGKSFRPSPVGTRRRVPAEKIYTMTTIAKRAVTKPFHDIDGFQFLNFKTLAADIPERERA